jgi:hypothetical protein
MKAQLVHTLPISGSASLLLKTWESSKVLKQNSVLQLWKQSYKHWDEMCFRLALLELV